MYIYIVGATWELSATQCSKYAYHVQMNLPSYYSLSVDLWKVVVELPESCLEWENSFLIEIKRIEIRANPERRDGV